MDILHHAHLTSTEAAAANHRSRFRANINAQAAELRRPKVVIPIREQIISEKIEVCRVETPAAFKRPIINRVQEFVAELYGVTREDLSGASRRTAMVRPRHVAIYVARHLSKQSWHQLATKFGNRDHSSMIHAVQRITELRETDRELNDEVDHIVSSLST